jgi:hypothetical protein
MKILFIFLAFLFIFETAPDAIVAQPDTTKTGSISSSGPFAGYPTWKDYVIHQDSASNKQHPIQLEWLTWGLGSESELPYQYSDYAVFSDLSYQQNNMLYRVRFLDARDYNFGSNSESLDEFDALIGYGSYQPVILNGSIGVGFRHRFHYLDDPYQENLPPHVTVTYLDLPMQAELLIPFGSNFGVGLTYYATLSHEGFDHGLLIDFSIGFLNENGTIFGSSNQP